MQTEKLNLQLEIKSVGSREFEGHGSVFRNVDLGGDIVVPGAFKASLKDHQDRGTQPAMFWMHQPDQVPGKWLEMHEDDKGLFVKGTLADTTLGNDMRTLLNMKAVRGLSIGYRLSGRRSPDGQRMDVDWDEDGNRLLKEVDLWEVSIVSLAMNPLARVEASKSRLSETGEYVPTAREFERMLRDVGCTQLTAKRIISAIFDDSGIRDVDRTRDVTVDGEADEILESIHKLTGNFVTEGFRI